MTKDEMLDMIDSWENLPFLITGITENNINISLLAEIALHSNHPKSWRAAWLMDKIHEEKPALVSPFVTDMIKQIKTEQNEGKKRHFLKLISLGNIPPEELGFLFEHCLNTFCSEKEPLAVRVHAMQILYNITETEIELKPEVLAIIEHQMENHASAGIVSRGRKLAKRLREQIRIKS